MTRTSRRTWAFRLCSKPYSIGIFNFFKMDLWQRLDQSCVQLSIFGVLLLFGCQLSGLKSKLVNCHGGVSWVCHEFSRCLTFCHIWFSNLLEVCLGQKSTGSSTPKGTARGPSWMKSYPNWQAKWWLQWHLTDFVMIQCEEIPWFLKISWILFVQEKSGLKILPISISSEMTSFSSEG